MKSFVFISVLFCLLGCKGPNPQSNQISFTDTQLGQDAYTPIKHALEVLYARGGGIVVLPAGSFKIVMGDKQSVYLPVTNNVTITGAVDSKGNNLTTLVFVASKNAGYIEGWRNDNNVTLKNLNIERGSDVTMVFANLNPGENINIDHINFDGHKDIYSNVVHFIKMGSMGKEDQVIKGLTVENSKIKNVSFVAFQPNDGRIEVSNINFINNIFENYGEGLEFNAPSVVNGMHDIAVSGNRFLNSTAGGEEGAGFSVGFANAHNAKVVDNVFDNNNHEAIHIEDGSYNITIEKNKIKNCGKVRFATALEIIGGATRDTHDIFFINNQVDDRNNPSKSPVVGILRGGAVTLPHDITIKENTFKLGKNQSPGGIYVEAGSINHIENNITH